MRSREATSDADWGQRTRRGIPERFPNPSRLSPAALVFVTLALALAGCRPCGRVDDALQARIEAELAEVGPGGVPGGGFGDHMRLSLDRTMTAFAVAPLTETAVFRSVARGRTVPVDGGADVVLDGEIMGRIAGLELRADAGVPVAVVRVDANVGVQLDALDRRSRYASAGATLRVAVPLSFVPAERGPTLVADFTQAALEEVSFAPVDMPEGYADIALTNVVALVDVLAAELVATANAPVSLLTWPHLELGGARVLLSPSRLAVDASGETLVLGVVSELRPAGALAESPPLDRAFAYDIHPDLWRAALLGLHASGRGQRRFDPDGGPSLDGAIVAAIDHAELRAAGARLELTLYCTASPCAQRPNTLAGTPALVDGRLAAPLDPSGDAVVDAAGAYAAGILDALVAPPRLSAAGGFAFRFDVAAFYARRGGVRVAGEGEIVR